MEIYTVVHIHRGILMNVWVFDDEDKAIAWAEHVASGSSMWHENDNIIVSQQELGAKKNSEEIWYDTLELNAKEEEVVE